MPLTPSEAGIDYKSLINRVKPSPQPEVVAASYSIVFESLHHFIRSLQTTNTSTLTSLTERIGSPEFTTFEDLARLKIACSHEHGYRNALHMVMTKLEALHGEHSSRKDVSDG